MVRRPVPARTIAAVIGAPAQDAAALHEWSSLVQRQFDIRALAAEPERIERAVRELYDYVAGLLDQRRREPADDLISALLRVEAEGERLSGPECVNLVLNVLAGGVDTTAAQLAHALRLFAGHPGQWEALRQRPELVGRAVDEVLRFEPITPFTARLCTEQIEHRGVIFPVGTIVAVCAERANRETGSGDEFDITAGLRPGRLGAPRRSRGHLRHRVAATGLDDGTAAPGQAVPRSHPSDTAVRGLLFSTAPAVRSWPGSGVCARLRGAR